jgi:hypothetical protein
MLPEPKGSDSLLRRVQRQDTICGVTTRSSQTTSTTGHTGPICHRRSALAPQRYKKQLVASLVGGGEQCPGCRM